MLPGFKCLSLEIYQFKDLVLNNSVCSPIKVDIRIFSFDEKDFYSIKSSMMKTLRTFLVWISKVTNLSLSSSYSEGMYIFLEKYSVSRIYY